MSRERYAARISGGVGNAMGRRILSPGCGGFVTSPTTNLAMIALFVMLGACRPAEVAVSTASTMRALTAVPDAEDLDSDPAVVRVRLTAARRSDDSGYAYGYNGLSPGPTIRARVGDELIVVLDNQLDEPTTIHWHGAGAPFAMDGVAWMRQPTMPGETFEYRFVLRKAGSFWYHPHFNTSGQVDGGLYGMLLVTGPDEPTPDEDLVLIFDAEDELHNHGTTRAPHGHSRLSTRWRINGQQSSVLTLKGGTVVRARLLNASNTAYLSLVGGALHVIGGDQGLAAERASVERLVLAPGERADLEWRMGALGFQLSAEPYTLLGGRAYGAPADLLQVVVESPAARPSPLDWPFSGATPTADSGTTDIVYAFAGSDRTGEWRINGEKFPNVTIERLRINQAAVIEVRNLSPSEHPFHMHGMPFEVLSVNGRPPSRRLIKDTMNLRIRDVVRLRVVADNVGDWMVHCHILPHADDGMMTVLRVE